MSALDDLSALFLNCTLKRSPAESNTEALARVVMEALERDGVACELVRLVDLDIRPGVSSDEGAMDLLEPWSRPGQELSRG